MKIGDILIFVYTNEPRYKIVNIDNNGVTLSDIRFQHQFQLDERDVKDDIENGYYFISKQYLFNEQLQEIISEI